LGKSGQMTQSVLSEMRIYFSALVVFGILDFFVRGVLPKLHTSSLTVSLVHWFVHVFLCLMFIFSLRITLSFFNPRLKTPATILTGLLAVVVLVARAVYPDTYQLIPGTGEYTLLPQNLYVIIPSAALSVLSVGLGGLYLVIKGFMQQDSTVRTRALFLGIGFLAELLEVPAVTTHSSWSVLLVLLSFIPSIYFLGLSTLLILKDINLKII
jgi:hypothetical protein